MKHLLIILCLVTSFSLFAATGDSCSDPLIAAVGPNDVSTLQGDQWFSFTASHAGDYLVNCTESLYQLNIFSDCDNTEVPFDFHYDNGIVTLADNQTVFLQWKSEYFKKEFQFNLAIAEDGDALAKPLMIESLGEITFPAEKKTVYYAYVLNAAKVLKADGLNDVSCAFFTVDGNSVSDPLYHLNQAYLEPGTSIISVSSALGTAFQWQLSARDPFPGEYCHTPQVISESGTITVPEDLERSYYSFTATDNGLIAFGSYSSYLMTPTIYNGCDGDQIFMNYNDELIVEKDKTYIAFVGNNFTSGSFDFSVTYDKGLTCDAAIEISTLGEVTFPVVDRAVFMSITLPEDGLYRVDAPDVEPSGGESSNMLAVYNSCGDYDYNSYLASSYDKDLYFEGEAGHTYIIVNNGGWGLNLDDNLILTIEKNTVEGMSCDLPKQLTAVGEYTFDGDFDIVYYSYTVTKDCNLTVSDGDDVNSVKMFKDCAEEHDDYYSTKGELSMPLLTGETVYIKWEKRSSLAEDFTWSLTEKDFEGGEMCQYPEVLTDEGTFTFNDERGVHYYSFTPSLTGYAVITSSNTSYTNSIYVRKECGGDYEYAENKIRINIKEGEPFLIEWQSSYTAWEWTLEEFEGEPGESCSKPISLQSLANGDVQNLTVSSKTGTYYSYTPAENQILSVSADTYFKCLITDECSSLDYGSEKEYKQEIIAGIPYYIVLGYVNAATEVSIGVRDVIEGETINKPIVLTEAGMVEYNSELDKIYYQYVATEDYAIDIDYDSDKLALNCGLPIYVTQGQTVTFAMTKNADGASFELIFNAIVDGEICSKPLVPVVGDNSYSGDLETVYYKYVPLVNSTVTVSSEHSERVVVSEGCNYSSYLSNEGMLSFEALAGKEYIIDWRVTESSGLTWNLEERTPVEGEVHSKPKPMEEGINSFVGFDKGLMVNYLSYIPEGHQKVVLSDMPGSVLITEKLSGDTLLFSYDQTLDFMLTDGVEYLIKNVRNPFGGSSNEWTMAAEVTGYAQYEVSFIVSNEKGLLQNATVQFDAQTRTTDSDGSVTFSAKKGSYDYTVSIEGTEVASGQILISNKNVTQHIDLAASAGLQDHEINLTLAPNPVSTSLYITSSQAIKSLSVYTIDGALVDAYHSNKECIDVSIYPVGVYLLKINFKDKIVVKQFVKK